MAYEYEEDIKNTISTEAVFSHEKKKKQERVNELNEVYRKAKAFDEIRKIEIQSDITGYHDDTESYMHDVESVIEKYLEDE